MCSGSEAGSYLRLIDSCITQLKAQGPSRTSNESKEEEEKNLPYPYLQAPPSSRPPTFGILSLVSRPSDVKSALQGYLAHKKHPPP